MPSEIIWGTLAGLFISAIYIANKLILRNGKTENPSATWMQRHVTIVIVVALLIPLGIGAVLVNTVFGKTTVVRRVRRHHPHGHALSGAQMPPPKPEPMLKLVISDGSKETDIQVLNQCRADEVTIIQNGTVNCVQHESPQVKTWMEDTRRQEEELLRKYIKSQTKVPPARVTSSQRAPAVMRQGFWFAPAAPAETDKEEMKKETKQKPFKDRHAELFYFLALVLGVMGKYFWDYYEDKRVGKAAAFEPHLIVMSFIIAALVYYSIQQGIEKEVNKFTIRGVVFAFNNGFMWQTILTGMNRNRNGTPATNAEPAA